MVAAAGAAIVIAAIGVVGFAAPASAHTATLKASTACSTDGSATVTWTISNDYNLVATVIETDNSAIPGGTTIAAARNGNTTVTLTQQIAAPAAGKKASASLMIRWSDGYKQNVSQSITVPKNCTVQVKKDATADVRVTPPTCDQPGSATVFGLENAKLVGKLDTSVGTHTATFKARNGHTFADGSKTLSVPYTVAPATGDQNSNPTGSCYVPTKDADASVTVTPATCGTAGTPATANVAFATLNGELDTTAGAHTATFTAVAGHVFADGSTTKTVPYTVPDALPNQGTNPDQPCYVAPNAPSLAGSVATGRCVADAPWIFYDVTVTNPDDVPLTGHDVKLVLTDGTNTVDVALGTITGNSGHISGKVLWPGASVAADGVTPTGWPGWEKMSDGTWVMVPGNYAWTRSLTSATLEVNPSLKVAMTYPPATPNCTDAPMQLTSNKTGSGSGLADTGSNVAFGSLAGGLALLVGGAFVLMAIIRRRRSTES